ncbi:MAG: CoB--CoM heterodisulfide reductase iron-sulfur subunit B family protein [Ignavibacteria bacterium]|nr:CoB--CoM heterodisulfide reductase iron-sulfur subunit B family protein [Ignavibacteria bacterium]
MTMNFGYYPGCSLEGTAKEFDKSLKAVIGKLGVNLQEVQDWACCGSSSAHATNHMLSVALPTHNLLLAKQQGLENVVAPCAACFNRLVVAQHEMATDEKVRAKVEDILERPYNNHLDVLNIIQFFDRVGTDVIKEKVTKTMEHLNAACYYGCLLVRPNDITKFDDAENPEAMERVVEATGAKTVSWNFKTECCGASHSIAHTEIAVKLSKRIIDDAIKHGANVIVVACPMCHSNLDMRQVNMKKQFPNHQEIPVLYLTELIGLALGLDAKALGVDLHFTNAAPVLK